MSCRLERSNEQPAIAGRALDADDYLASVALDKPGAKPPHALRAVGEAERAELTAALVQQRSDMGALVHIDPDDHEVLLSRG
jgi:hypothetical protein